MFGWCFDGVLQVPLKLFGGRSSIEINRCLGLTVELCLRSEVRVRFVADRLGFYDPVTSCLLPFQPAFDVADGRLVFGGNGLCRLARGAYLCLRARVAPSQTPQKVTHSG